MRAIVVPMPLRERLGESGSEALTDMLDEHTRQTIDYAIDRSIERFERRLVEEISKVRVEMAGMRADLSTQLSARRLELITWSFAFWIGQLIAIVGILSVMLRSR